MLRGHLVSNNRKLILFFVFSFCAELLQAQLIPFTFMKKKVAAACTSGSVIYSAISTSWTIPAGCTHLRFKVWGAGGGGGGSGSNQNYRGADGGSGGYIEATYIGTPGSSLTIEAYIGGGGASNYYNGVTLVSNLTGAGGTPPNTGDAEYTPGVGVGGAGGALGGMIDGISGGNGSIVIIYDP